MNANILFFFCDSIEKQQKKKISFDSVNFPSADEKSPKIFCDIQTQDEEIKDSVMKDGFHFEFQSTQKKLYTKEESEVFEVPGHDENQDTEELLHELLLQPRLQQPSQMQPLKIVSRVVRLPSTKITNLSELTESILSLVQTKEDQKEEEESKDHVHMHIYFTQYQVLRAFLQTQYGQSLLQTCSPQTIWSNSFQAFWIAMKLEYEIPVTQQECKDIHPASILQFCFSNKSQEQFAKVFYPEGVVSVGDVFQWILSKLECYPKSLGYLCLLARTKWTESDKSKFCRLLHTLSAEQTNRLVQSMLQYPHLAFGMYSLLAIDYTSPNHHMLNIRSLQEEEEEEQKDDDETKSLLEKEYQLQIGVEQLIEWNPEWNQVANAEVIWDKNAPMQEETLGNKFLNACFPFLFQLHPCAVVYFTRLCLCYKPNPEGVVLLLDRLCGSLLCSQPTFAFANILACVTQIWVLYDWLVHQIKNPKLSSIHLLEEHLRVAQQLFQTKQDLSGMSKSYFLFAALAWKLRDQLQPKFMETCLPFWEWAMIQCMELDPSLSQSFTHRITWTHFWYGEWDHVNQAMFFWGILMKQLGNKKIRTHLSPYQRFTMFYKVLIRTEKYWDAFNMLAHLQSQITSKDDVWEYSQAKWLVSSILNIPESRMITAKDVQQALDPVSSSFETLFEYMVEKQFLPQQMFQVTPLGLDITEEEEGKEPTKQQLAFYRLAGIFFGLALLSGHPFKYTLHPDVLEASLELRLDIKSQEDAYPEAINRFRSGVLDILRCSLDDRFRILSLLPPKQLSQMIWKKSILKISSARLVSAFQNL